MSEEDSADEDDWFESALRDDPADGNPAESGEPVGDDARSDSSVDDEPTDEERDPAAGSGSGPGEESTPGAGDSNDGEGDAASAFTADGTDGEGPFAAEAGQSESPFDDGSVADAGDASPFGDTGVGGDAQFGETDAFSSGSGGGGMFDEGFDDAMGSMGDEGSDFDQEEFESEIPRLDLGIEGLDNMIQGGVPERHLMVVVGGAGTGKTTFGLEFLQHGLTKDDTDRGVFITLEQTYDDIMATADESGWEFRRHEEAGDLAIVDLDPVEMANSLDNIRGELPELIEEFDADRFVLDSVSLLEMMYDDQARRRTEVFDFTQSLKNAGVTTVFTSEANESNPYASRHGIIEYLTDAVFLLRYVRSETQETRLAVEIQKIRNANHSRETKPYEITAEGISVYEQANIF